MKDINAIKGAETKCLHKYIGGEKKSKTDMTASLQENKYKHTRG